MKRVNIVMENLKPKDKVDLVKLDFKCIVCTDILKAPVSLECGHTICLVCAERLQHKSCPVCRHQFRDVTKNTLLCSILEEMYGEQYKELCGKAGVIKKYYGGSRFDSLQDIVIDMVSAGEQDPISPEFKDFFITKGALMNSIEVNSIEIEHKYTEPEIELCIHELIKDNHIYQVKNYLLLTTDSWVCDKLTKFADTMSSDDILLSIARIMERNVNRSLGQMLQKRRKLSIVNPPPQDVTILEDKIYELIKNKKIEL